MKKKFIIISAVIFSLALSINCYAKEYVIKINDSIQLFSHSDSPADKFVTVDESELQDYIDAGVVEYYEENISGYLIPLHSSKSSSENVEGQGNIAGTDLWNHKNINALFPLNIGAHGNRVKVAVIDTGITIHQGLTGRVLEGYDYHKKTTDVTDEDGHGTFVSSIIASKNHGFGVESYIVPLKVFYDSGRTDENGKPIQTLSSSDLKDAIFDAVEKYDCDVINMSLTLNTSVELLKHIQEAITYAKDNGVILVAAAGNEGSEKIFYPAAYEDVIGVGSVDEDNNRSDFSQKNTSVFVTAPGEWVYSTFGKYNENGELISEYSSGTSFAAPHVSALASIAKCIKPEITNDEFKTLLSQTANNVNNDEGYDTEYGYGVIDCEKAVKKLIEGRKIYISPVFFDSGNSGVLLYNNTDKPINFTLLYTSTDKNDNKLIKKVNVTDFPANIPVKMGVSFGGGSLKYMAWNSLKDIVPISIASEYSEE